MPDPVWKPWVTVNHGPATTVTWWRRDPSADVSQRLIQEAARVANLNQLSGDATRRVNEINAGNRRVTETNEMNRRLVEGGRSTSETNRQVGELNRSTNETNRRLAELGRSSAETFRRTTQATRSFDDVNRFSREATRRFMQDMTLRSRGRGRSAPALHQATLGSNGQVKAGSTDWRDYIDRIPRHPRFLSQQGKTIIDSRWATLPRDRDPTEFEQRVLSEPNTSLHAILDPDDRTIGYWRQDSGYQVVVDVSGNPVWSAERGIVSVLSPIDFIPFEILGSLAANAAKLGVRAVGRVVAKAAVREVGEAGVSGISARVVRGLLGRVVPTASRSATVARAENGIVNDFLALARSGETGSFREGGIDFGRVSVTREGDSLIVRRDFISDPTKIDPRTGLPIPRLVTEVPAVPQAPALPRPPGRGFEIQDAYERAAARAGRQLGVREVRVEMGSTVNFSWQQKLITQRGYRPGELTPRGDSQISSGIVKIIKIRP